MAKHRLPRLLTCAALLTTTALAVAAEGRRPVVFVTLPPQAWLVRRLAGDALEVESLLTPGANPHTFEPGARQIKRLAEASLYLTAGFTFEETLTSRAARLNPNLTIVPLDAGITKLGAHAHAHAPGQFCSGHGGDPHIWLSPALFSAMASNAAPALARLLPERHDALQQALRATVEEIAATDLAVRAKLDGLTVRTWVVYHPSWSYFAADYGLSLLVIEKDGKAPPARHLAGVIRQARAAGVRTVFTEPQYDARPAQTLADQLGARLATIDPLHADWPALMRDVAAKLAEGTRVSP